MTVTVAQVRANIPYRDAGHHPVPGGYSETRYSPGPDGHQYRDDCSGTVSLWAQIHDNPYTGAMIGDTYSKAITKGQLEFGDIMIAVAGNGWSAGHVVMFDHWVDTAHTVYFGHEFGWGDYPAHRNITYPYSDPDGKQDSRTFQPRRLLAISRAPDTPDPAGNTYTVHPGDTLSEIAQRLLGSADRYADIAAYNKLPDANQITVGQVLRIPDGPVNITVPPAKPRPVKPGVAAPPFPLGRIDGHQAYYGPLSGPNWSISGLFHTDTDAQRAGLRTWQQRMAARGWRIQVTGHFDGPTPGVARAFQQEKGLTVDGCVGPQTWGAAWTAPIT